GTVAPCVPPAGPGTRSGDADGLGVEIVSADVGRPGGDGVVPGQQPVRGDADRVDLSRYGAACAVGDGQEGEGSADAVGETGGGGAGGMDGNGRGVVGSRQPPAGAGVVSGEDHGGEGGERGGQAWFGSGLPSGVRGQKDAADAGQSLDRVVDRPWCTR